MQSICKSFCQDNIHFKNNELYSIRVTKNNFQYAIEDIKIAVNPMTHIKNNDLKYK